MALCKMLISTKEKILGYGTYYTVRKGPHPYLVGYDLDNSYTVLSYLLA